MSWFLNSSRLWLQLPTSEVGSGILAEQAGGNMCVAGVDCEFGKSTNLDKQFTLRQIYE